VRETFARHTSRLLSRAVDVPDSATPGPGSELGGTHAILLSRPLKARMINFTA